MAEKPQTLCKWKREEYTEHFAKLCKIVAKPRFVCKKCGRVSDRKKWLCEPRPLK
jgi:hypothetical protein